MRACSTFFAWCEDRGLILTTTRPFDVEAWVEQLQEKHGAPGVKQQLAAVLAPVKDKPSGRPQDGAVLDRRCARQPHRRAGRDGRMAPPGAEQKNGSKQEDKMTLRPIP